MEKITQNILCLVLTAALAFSLLPSSFAEDGDASIDNTAAQEAVTTDPSDTLPPAESEPTSSAETDPQNTPENGDNTEEEETEPSADPSTEPSPEPSTEPSPEPSAEPDEEDKAPICLCVIDESSLMEGSSIATERLDNGLYASLADALAFAEDGDTIKICKDSVFCSAPIEKSIILNLNGNNFVGPLICAAENLVVKEGIISVGDSKEAEDGAEEPDSSSETSGENGEASSENEESGKTEKADSEEVNYAIINYEGCSITLESCVVDGPLSGSFALTNGTFSVKPDAAQIAPGYYIRENNALYTVVHGITCTDINGVQSYLTPVIDDKTLIINYDGTLNLEDLEAYAIDNNASSIMIYSEMGSETLATEVLSAQSDNTGSLKENSTQAPKNTIITDEKGSVFFSAKAEGGSLKLPVTEEGVLALDDTSTEKATLRFQYSFTVPVQPDELTWSWKIFYRNEIYGKDYSLTIHGIKYSQNCDGSFTSNAIVTNIPASVYDTDLNAILTLSFKHNNLTYTVTQYRPDSEISPDSKWLIEKCTPETRSIRAVASHLYNNTQNTYTDYYYDIASHS